MGSLKSFGIEMKAAICFCSASAEYKNYSKISVSVAKILIIIYAIDKFRLLIHEGLLLTEEKAHIFFSPDHVSFLSKWADGCKYLNVYTPWGQKLQAEVLILKTVVDLHLVKPCIHSHLSSWLLVQ